MSAAPESARPVDSADSLDDDDATVASQPTDRPAGRLASRIRLRGTRISGLESPESDMDGRHAARRSLEPVQGARAKARASRADDLVGASVLSLSLSPSFSRSHCPRALPVSLFPSRRQSAFYSRGLSLLRALSLLSRGRATGCTLRLPAFLSAPSLSLSVFLSRSLLGYFPFTRSLTLFLSCARARAVLKVLSFGVVLTSKPSDFAHTLPSCPAIAALVTHLDASNCLST